MFKMQENVFVPERFDVLFSEKVRLGRNFTIRVQTSLPVEGDTSKTIDKVVLLDGFGGEIQVLTMTNSNAVAAGKAEYCSYSVAVNATALDTTYQVIAINGNGVRSTPVIVAPTIIS